MKETRILMGMPITVEIPKESLALNSIDQVFDYFNCVEQKFSPYKETSEVSKVNQGLLPINEYSTDMEQVLKLCEETKSLTDGYFDIFHNGKIDPSGLVKGWAIYNASKILDKYEFQNYYIEAGGDIQVKGKNEKNELWRIGIRNPFNIQEIIKIVQIGNQGIATSGTYIRGQHVYNPHQRNQDISEIVSLTVIGPNIYEADRFATAVFAMGKRGIEFIEKLNGFEGYQIDKQGIGTYTSGFERYIVDTNE